MTHFECSECGQFARFVDIEQSAVRQPCPICDEPTLWTIVFDDREGGVSY